ncbi:MULTISPECIES: hypothetical protein [Pseudonocardia]|uniref:Terminase-like family protein n=2 Tax=Pseudonocardia TaxID=1847 RepID=A0A1Y2N6X6_PSEAH|nr:MULTISPECIES: hypothetical protein [Pseudonocardia]OSY42929.1 hypothetical protein BG845_01171 [Pseudonocardia autotrophica]TDN77505.1 hypothetical protein C8E95_6753 [Pseudonocardia autotrophica]BBG01530.1 hypothetical protein Pdca_27390 [Pseudonocardia autotrophica]GEC25314.1 hypothetical protein PSA01_23430 [Pseudonocardia saturnea]
MTTSVAFPSGFDAGRLLAPMMSPAMESSSHYRRAVTETDPIRFALTFLPHHLSSSSTGGQISLSPFHLAMAKVARRWMRDEPRRDIWVAPRRAAKSTWQHVILPLWALAHGHRNTFMSFSHSSAQAQKHMANLRTELAGNELLLADFPELRPVRGNGASNSAALVSTRGGRVFATGGMDSGALGTKFGSERVGILCLDDVEPGESNYSPGKKEKRLTTLLDDVIPMGEKNTVVSLCGTTTMHGSIIHDAVQHAAGRKHAQWVVDEEFRVHHFSPFVDHPDGSRSSMWPAMWPLEWLLEREGTRRFAKNYLNDPAAAADGAFWVESLFRREEIPTVRRVLSIDPAVSTNAGSDFTAIAAVGVDGSGRRFEVDYARQFKVSPAHRREVVHRLCVQNPDIDEVIVEQNQGGDTWRAIFEPLPGRARLTLFSVRGSKASRLEKLLDRYERGQVVHGRPVPELEEQALAYPSPAVHDDLLDAVSNGVEHLARQR